MLRTPTRTPLYTRTIVENIPNTAANRDACEAFVALERANTGRVIRMRRRGRGPRLERVADPVSGEMTTIRHFQELPLRLAERFTMYTEDARGPACGLWAEHCSVARFDFRGRRADGKTILRYKGSK